MKKQTVILIGTFLITIILSMPRVYAQEKTQNEKKRDIEIQRSIDEQKKAMAEQKRAQIEMRNMMQKHREELDSLNVSVSVDDLDKLNDRMIYMNIPRSNRSFNFNEPFVFNGEDMSGFFGHMGDEQRTSWDFSKTVKDNTFSGDYSFEVDKTAKSVVMAVMGDCKSGEIRIKIIMPNGKSYSDILIDESGNLNWRKSFAISDTENKDKTGNWKFQISSSKATGFFKISLQAF